MSTVSVSIAAILAAVALFATACGGGGGDPIALPLTTPTPALEAPQLTEDASDATAGEEQQEDEPEEPTATPTVSPSLLGPPYAAGFSWGDFTLAEDITDRLFEKERLTFVLSISDRSVDESGALVMGWRRGVEEVSATQGRDIFARTIGPSGPDAGARAVDLAALLEEGEVDCLAVDSGGDSSMADSIDAAVAAGIPVFALGADSPFSRRFAFYGIDELEAGRLAGSFVGQWANEGRILLLKAGLLAQDPSSASAQSRMQGFVEAFQTHQPHVEFVNSPEDLVPLGFDPIEVYDDSAVWVQEHPDVDIILAADGGLEELARAIGDQYLHGDVYTVGFGMSQTIGNLVHDGVVVATILEGLEDQSVTAAQACGNFLFDGVYDDGVVGRTPLVVHEDNLEASGWARPEIS